MMTFGNKGTHARGNAPTLPQPQPGPDGQPLPPWAPQPPPRKPGWFSVRKRALLTALGVVAAFAVGSAIGASGHAQTVTKTVAGPAQVKTVTRNVPVPGETKTVTKKVPGPAVTKVRTVYVPASQGPAGTVIASYSGTGNENTGSFPVPSSGDYVVKWAYSGNSNPSLGGAANFSVSATDNTGMTGSYPNDIATSGSGSTEDTSMSGMQSFNVQAAGQWTISVTSAP